MKSAAERRPLDLEALRQIFVDARTPNSWSEAPVGEALLRQVYELARFGPTSANTNPARIVWVRTDAGKRKLADVASPGNRRKILGAPVTAIVGYDLDFADRLPALFPHNFAPMQDMARDEEWRQVTGARNGTLQGAYLIIAARALGLDCGPLSGFNNMQVDAAFFADRPNVRSNFLCCLGYGTSKDLFPRLPRLSFEDANTFA